MDLRLGAAEHLRDHRRRPPEWHAGVRRQNSRRSNLADRRLRALAERADAEGRVANAQRPHPDERVRARDQAAAAKTEASGAPAMSPSSSGQWRRQWLSALVPIIATALPAYGRVQSSLDPAGPDALRISRLWWLMLIVCTAVFLVVLGFMLQGILRGRRRQEAATDEQST